MPTVKSNSFNDAGKVMGSLVYPRVAYFVLFLIKVTVLKFFGGNTEIHLVISLKQQLPYFYY